MMGILRGVLALVLAIVVAGAAYAGDQTRRFKPVTWNGTAPRITKDGVLFTLEPGKCGAQTYGDGRGESDCNGGRLRSQLQAPKAVPVGQDVIYSFEFLVPDWFVYDGDPRFPADSRLLIAEWKRDRGIKNHLYEMLLDSIRGVTFERKVCITPADFGRWNAFTLRIKWTPKGDGFMEARCNERVILQRLNTQTVIPPDCGAPYKLQCFPELQQPDADILWSVGPNLSGYGRDYRKLGRKTPFAPFPPKGVQVMMRNLEVRRVR